MGRRGPPEKPTVLKKLNGSPRARKESQQPLPPDGVPKCPEHLDKEAKGYWKNLTALLADMGLLSKADGDMLAMYCQSLARLRQCEAAVNEHGLTYTKYAPDGTVSMIKIRPEQQMAKELYAVVMRLGREFGLSPSSRAHLQVPEVTKKQTVSEKAKFFIS